MRLIDADELRNELTSICSDKVNDYNKAVKAFIELIDNAPTVCNDNYSMGYQDGVKKVLSERPHGECRTCKYYHPYFEKFSNDPRGDGYCVIARMTPEGMTTINCNDEFSCSDYQKIEGGGA